MLLAIFFFLFSTSHAAGGIVDPIEGRFINPPELGESSPGPLSQPIYRVDNDIEVEWQVNTPTTVLDLVIKQYGNAEQNKPPNSDNLAKNRYSWRVTVDGSDGGSKFDLLASNQFSFELYRKAQAGRIATSGWFNVSNATVDQYGEYIGPKPLLGIPLPTSTGVNESASITISTTSTFLTATSYNNVSATAAPTSTVSTVSTDAKENSAPNTEMYVGIAVGVVVCGVGVIIAFCIWWSCIRGKKWEKRRQAKMQQRADSRPPYKDISEAPPGAPYELKGSESFGSRWLASSVELQESEKVLGAELQSNEKRCELQNTEKDIRSKLAG